MTPDPGGSGAPRRRDRAIVIALLVAITALAWAYTVHQANMMDAMDAAMWRQMSMSMNEMAPSWTPLGALFLFVMWTAMMAAMMVPGTAPMVMAFATINRRLDQIIQTQLDEHASRISSSIFACRAELSPFCEF